MLASYQPWTTKVNSSLRASGVAAKISPEFNGSILCGNSAGKKTAKKDEREKFHGWKWREAFRTIGNGEERSRFQPHCHD
jgi:hypothetical protein